MKSKKLTACLLALTLVVSAGLQAQDGGSCEACQKAALMAKAKGETSYFAHPFAWAPFFLVGEGSVE